LKKPFKCHFQFKGHFTFVFGLSAVGNQNVNLIDNPFFVHNKNFIYPNREWGSFFIFTFQNLFQPKEGQIQNHFLFTFLSKIFETLWDVKSLQSEKTTWGC
jgi:hypothetical protein